MPQFLVSTWKNHKKVFQIVFFVLNDFSYNKGGQWNSALTSKLIMSVRFGRIFFLLSPQDAFVLITICQSESRVNLPACSKLNAPSYQYNASYHQFTTSLDVMSPHQCWFDIASLSNKIDFYGFTLHSYHCLWNRIFRKQACSTG